MLSDRWASGLGALAATVALGLGVLAGGALVKAQQAAPPPPPVAQPPIGGNQPRDAVPLPTAPDDDQAADEPAPSEAPAAVAPPKPVVPPKRPKYAVAILQALDKVTAETERFEVPLNTPVRYKNLIFVVRACETNASDEDIVEAAAHVEIISQPRAPQGGAAPPARVVFKGWMFANSPGLNLVQHPIYDAWLIACKTEIPSA